MTDTQMQGWKWSVRLAEGGTLERKAPPRDLTIVMAATWMSNGHQLQLFWRDQDKYHQTEKFVSDVYRRTASRPSTLISHEVAPGLTVKVTMDHPDAERGEDVHDGATFRVYYTWNGETREVAKTKGTGVKLKV